MKAKRRAKVQALVHAEVEQLRLGADIYQTLQIKFGNGRTLVFPFLPWQHRDWRVEIPDHLIPGPEDPGRDAEL